MSAQACLAGLYPPTDEEKWHDEIMWHPIPIHTIPLNMDHVLSTARRCEAYKAAHEKHMENSPEVQRVFVENKHLVDHWSQESGSPIETILDVFRLYDTLIREKEQNKRSVKMV